MTGLADKMQAQNLRLEKLVATLTDAMYTEVQSEAPASV